MTDAHDTISRKAATDAVQQIVYEPMKWNVGAYSVGDARFHNPSDAVIASIRALPSVGVTVNPLEWVRGIVDCAKPMPGMKYVACSTTPHGCWAWWLDGDNSTRTVERDEQHAKAAAQADYEARIMAALDVQPAPDVAQVRAEALREVLERLQALVPSPAGGPFSHTNTARVTALDAIQVVLALLDTPPAPSPDVAALIERVITAQDTALAFSDILTTETLSGRTEVMAFCQRLEKFLFPAILAALARKGGDA